MVELRAPGADAVVVADPEGGGRITRIAVDGTELLTAAGLWLMAPFAGRTGYGRFTHDGAEHRLPVDMPPHAIHGTVRGVAWTVEASTDDEAVLAAPLGPVWPWAGRCVHRIALRADHVELEATVESTSGDEFPAVLGWHPWFRKPAAVRFHADSMLERGGDGLPTGRRVAPVPPGDRALDDCFEGVRWPVHVDDLRIEADGCDDVVVYDEQAGTTCVEPQTGPPDALNQGGAALVRPREPLRATMRIRWA
jgi:aldose 1-epimerase